MVQNEARAELEVVLRERHVVLQCRKSTQESDARGTAGVVSAVQHHEDTTIRDKWRASAPTIRDKWRASAPLTTHEISGSIIQNSARCRAVWLGSARNVGPKVYTSLMATANASTCTVMHVDGLGD